ncbi:cytochrome oxidase assembly protein 1 [Malassezia yamatoensis]|uniref:Cytochrome oxidase assembly protein 1 n=1 Tax=Malassezia yamatoensis TaxID=253288 RepID=A0AAJ5YS16_9BASI|nr:cytochrome oxidase assembly protein 1 [Malassezia yamatoensis]
MVNRIWNAGLSRAARLPSPRAAWVLPLRSMSSRPPQPGTWEPRVTRVKSDIPKLPNNRPYYIAAGASLIALWYVLTTYLNNKERLGSSVLRTVSQRVKEASEVHSLLGEPVQLKRSSFGDPWIEGIINPLKGKVDMSFQVYGPRGTATVYFTSIRKAKGDAFEVLRFLIVPDADSSQAVSLLSGTPSPSNVLG